MLHHAAEQNSGTLVLSAKVILRPMSEGIASTTCGQLQKKESECSKCVHTLAHWTSMLGELGIMEIVELVGGGVH